MKVATKIILLKAILNPGGKEVKKDLTYKGSLMWESIIPSLKSVNPKCLTKRRT